MEQPRQIRYDIVGMEVDISDRVGFSTGTLKDISQNGICITNIPRKLHAENSLVTVAISAKRKRFKIQVRPKWQKQDGVMITTGANIVNVPWGWIELIKAMGPQEEDVWAYVATRN